MFRASQLLMLIADLVALHIRHGARSAHSGKNLLGGTQAASVLLPLRISEQLLDSRLACVRRRDGRRNVAELKSLRRVSEDVALRDSAAQEFIKTCKDGLHVEGERKLLR